MSSRTPIALAALALLCGSVAAQESPKDATLITQQANGAWLSRLPFSDRQDFEDAQRGFVAASPRLVIKNARGGVAWDLDAYAFLGKEQAPPTVNPSLWRQARLNLVNGLFKVTDRVYQVRGYDLSNMDVIEGDTGLIIVDPLIS
ncbi:MAG TPA: MBL fold metallo-hydrolase, partial [Dongiaceae bacterium]